MQLFKIKKSRLPVLLEDQKFQQKINVITNLIKNVNNIIIVGAMANNFLTFQRF